jgi:hypothetical protein
VAECRVPDYAASLDLRGWIDSIVAQAMVADAA